MMVFEYNQTSVDRAQEGLGSKKATNTFMYLAAFSFLPRPFFCNVLASDRLPFIMHHPGASLNRAPPK